ncbi:MAG TPA: hypothetical protein VGA79_02480 [Desulfobaccales bacterium]
MKNNPGFSFGTHGFEQGGIQVMGPGRPFSLVFTIKTKLRPIEYLSSNFSWWHRRLACAAQAKACGYKNNHLTGNRYQAPRPEILSGALYLPAAEIKKK